MDVAAARIEYGRVLSVELDGVELLFRPLTPLEATRAVRAVGAAPELAVETALATCTAACLTPELLPPLVDRYPLAFSGETGVLGELVRLAQGDAKVRVQSAVKAWRASDRNPGRMAENLLAFKAYQGGDYDAATFAGALTVAEWMGSTKGIFMLLSALLKALAKRRS